MFKNKKIVCQKKGFTLIEVIVAFAVLSMLVLMMANVFNTASTSYRIADHNVDLYQNARIIMDQISREIRSAVIHNNGTSYGFYKYAAGGSGWLPASSIGHELFFIAPWRVNDTQTSDLVEFGYYLDEGPSAWISDNVLRRCAVPDNGAGYNFLTANNWPQGNNYVDIGYHVRNFTVDWYGAWSLVTDPEAWQTSEYNSNMGAGDKQYLKTHIPRAIRIHLEMVHPEDVRKYGVSPKIAELTMQFNTIIYLNNSIPFN